jgi:hypothetical protein
MLLFIFFLLAKDVIFTGAGGNRFHGSPQPGVGFLAARQLLVGRGGGVSRDFLFQRGVCKGVGNGRVQVFFSSLNTLVVFFQYSEFVCVSGC